MPTVKEIINKTIAIRGELPLLLNDKEVPMILRCETETGGYYKNGYKCSKIDGKCGKYKYYKIHIYTVVKGLVDIEEKWLIRIENNGEYTIKQHLGWDNVDLTRFGENSEEYFVGLFSSFLKRM